VSIKAELCFTLLDTMQGLDEKALLGRQRVRMFLGRMLKGSELCDRYCCFLQKLHLTGCPEQPEGLWLFVLINSLVHKPLTGLTLKVRGRCRRGERRVEAGHLETAKNVSTSKVATPQASSRSKTGTPICQSASLTRASSSSGAQRSSRECALR
jgi:hypothetical protein